MKKIIVCCLLLSMWLTLDVSGVRAIDVGWMQQGVRVWYFGISGSGCLLMLKKPICSQLLTGTPPNLLVIQANHWSLPTAEG